MGWGGDPGEPHLVLNYGAGGTRNPAAWWRTGKQWNWGLPGPSLVG